MKRTHSLDEQYIDETLKLAEKGRGWTNPNPLVGCVIVKNGKVIARGFHKRAGGAHAEIEAFQSAKKSVEGATLYVNLEPCSHYGKTPPCAEAIIAMGIRRVVCSTLDPNKKVSGRGVTLLKKAGIEVSIGIREKEARKLNEAFFTYHTKKRAFVTIKFASSIDGKLNCGKGDSRPITNEKARAYARALRNGYQAILVGINTVLADNPHLGVRKKGLKDPTRIILDSRLRIPLKSHVLRDSDVLIATTSRASKTKIKQLEDIGASIVVFPGARISIKALLAELYKREIISIFVEGGGEVIGSFMNENLVDKVYAFYAPVTVGEKDGAMIRVRKTAKPFKFKDASVTHFGNNVLLTLENRAN